jgi:hemoglobin
MKPTYIMKTCIFATPSLFASRPAGKIYSLVLGLAFSVLIGPMGCGHAKTGGKEQDFFTSGSRDADQRASQRMARDEQLTGSGEGSAEKGSKKAKVANAGTNSATPGSTNKGARVEGKLALFDRLGGQPGISNIVADFLPRALQDPRVNWPRKGVRRGNIFGGKNESGQWQATPQNAAVLHKHLVEFLTLATGGPAQYSGKEMKSAHDGMRISNPEFDAAIGDLKASLDRLQIPNKEQKELLAIVESTRSQVVTQR